MANCHYCGQRLGWFEKSHPECKARYMQALTDLVRTASNAAFSGDDWDTLYSHLETIAVEGFCRGHEIALALTAAWLNGVDDALDDDMLTSEEIDRLGQFYDRFGLLGFAQRKEIEPNTVSLVMRAQERMQHALVLQTLLAGHIPSFNAEFPILLNLTKGESIVWGFENCVYYEDAISRTYIGASAGVSVKVAKGVYFRSGSFKGQPVESPYLKYIDTGIVVLTTLHVYFAGPHKTFRVPYSKIVGYRPYSDGIGIWRDTATVKQQVFVTGDGWFTYNLVANLAKGIPLKQILPSS